MTRRIFDTQPNLWQIIADHRDTLIRAPQVERSIVPVVGGLSVAKEKDIVQIKNPRSGHYVKIDRTEGKIIDHKKSEGPYKNVPIARKHPKGK
jgi:hypothetical protein